MVLTKELIDIRRKSGVTIVFVTHNIREAVLLSEKIAVMATRPVSIKKIFKPQTYTDWITSKDITLRLEQDIMHVLQGDIEEALTEDRVGDDRFKTDHLSRY